MKKLFLLLLVFVTTVVVNAEPVSRQQALQKARQFMPGKQFGEARSYARAKSPTGKVPFYVFNAKDKKGFVIVSGDDRTRPILGYADSGELEEEQMPENMKWWLDNLASQIEALGVSLKPAEVSSRRSGMAAIDPLIQTEWDQGAPYNYMCPDGDYHDKGDEGYDAGNLCVTGCVATAMAQVMYYWKWPKTCEAIDSYSGFYVKDGQHIKYGIVKGVPATTFKWDLMKTKYGYGETGEAADAVAELMRYCGQAVQMKYGVGSSSAYVHRSDMIGVFNYSNKIRELSRDNYTTAEWEALVYEELSADHPRPVLYSGRTSNVGHQFVVDGYDGDGLFHFNWGWGYSGSYSVLSLADPTGEYGNDGNSNNGFQYSQSALFGVKPAEPDEVMVPYLYCDLNEFLTQTFTRTGVDVDFPKITLNTNIRSVYVFTPETSLDVQIGWGLYQDDQFVGCLASTTKTLPQQQNYSFSNEQTLSFGKNLAVGKYQLSLIYRFSDSEAWKRCVNYETNSLVAEVSATSLTVRKPDFDNGSFTVNSITTSEQPEVGKAMDIFLNVTNTGETDKIYLYLWIQKSGSSLWTNVAQRKYYIYPGQSTDVKCGYTPTEGGTYTLKATDSSAPSSDALCTGTVTVATAEKVTVDGIVYLCTPLYKRAMVVKNENANKSVSSITIQQTVTASGVVCQVKAIGDNAFRDYWNVTQIEIPEGVETIGYTAFYNMYCLQRVILPPSITAICDFAFSCNSSLSSVKSHIADPFDISESVFAGSSSWDDTSSSYIFSPSAATLYVPVGTTSKYASATGWNMFASVEEGELKEAFDGVLKYSYSTGGTEATVIQDDSYQEMTEVVIPATATLDGKSYNVTAIGNNAFKNCYQLASVTLPDGLVSIGYRAFSNLSNLQKVILPSSITAIGDNAFFNNGSLSSVESHIAEPFDISESVFASSSTWDDVNYVDVYSPSSATLYVPIGTKSKYAAAKGWNMFAAVEEGELKEAFDGVLKYAYSTGGTEAKVIQDDSYKELTEVVIPATAMLGGKSYRVTAVGNNAFYGCNKLTSVTLPNSLVYIGRYSFAYMSNLQKVILPSTITAIDNYAFFNNQSLSSVESHIAEPFDISEKVFASSSTWDDTNNSYINSPSAAILYVPIGTKSKYAAAKGWNMFASVEEGELKEAFDGILKYSYLTGSTEATVIQDNSYQELTEVVIPTTATLDGQSYQVTAIGNNAFKGCYQLTSVTLPDGLVSIGYGAFFWLSNLQKVVLPSSVTAIGNYAFYNNRSLSSVESHIAEPFDISESVFASSSTWDDVNYVDVYSPSSATLYVPIGTKSKYAAAKGWNMFASVEEGELKEAFDGILKYSYLTGSTEATVIQDDSYEELTEVVIPATATLDGQSYQVTAIGNNAFADCYQLTSVTLPDGLVSIGNEAFLNTMISSITMPSTLRIIGNSAFEYCENLTSVVIPEGVEKVGNLAFSYMSNLERITLPSTLKEIGSRLLVWDGKLTIVVSNISVPFAVGDNTFIYKSQWNNETGQYDYTPSPAKLLVPKGKVAVYQSTAGWNWFTGISELGDGDANGDGEVTITDAVGIVNYILGNPSGSFNEASADINGDGKITITDAVGVVNIILNNGAAAPAMDTPQEQGSEATPE